MSGKCEIDLLYEAADIAGFDAAKGWPTELEWQQLIALMVGHEWLPPLGAPKPVTIEHPDGRVEQIGYKPNLASLESEERRLKRKACGIMMKMLRDAGLEISERIESIPQPPLMIFVSFNPTRTEPKEQPPEIRRTFVVTRQAVRSCLLSLRKDPPELVSAWLGGRRRNETAVERNRRIAAAVLDGEMTKAQAEAEGVKPDNLKRIVAAERKRRAAAQDGKASPSDKTANPMQTWVLHTTDRPQTGIAKPSPKKKAILSKT